MNTQYSAPEHTEHSSVITHSATCGSIWSRFALTTFVWLSVHISIPPSLSAQQRFFIQTAVENALPHSNLPQRPFTQPHEEVRHTEEIQYLRLSDLTGAGNTQYTYIPPRYDHHELQEHLHQARQMLTLEANSRVDVVVYLNPEGTITQINYIGEQVAQDNTAAKSACDAVKKCTFTPAYRNNKPVHSIVVIPVRFVL